MSELKKFQDEGYLKNEQYKSSANLGARANLHQRFSTAALPWQKWVFAQFQLRPNGRVLECGCGPGWLWRENLNRIPPNSHITLTDLSAGMVAEAEAALKNSEVDFQFQPANIQELPFAADSFDVVIANHMLYHVPDFEQAMREVRRVLKANGRFFAATNGAAHLQELWQLGKQLFAEFPIDDFSANESPIEEWHFSFSLESGTELLRPFFNEIEIYVYEDKLVVTEAEPILAYLVSSAKVTEIPARHQEQMLAFLQHKMNDSGSIIITKETCLFAAS